MARAEDGIVGLGKKGAALPTAWQDRFVAAYRKLGGVHLAAEAASISPEPVRRYRLPDPDFNTAVLDAREYYADTLEVNMIASAERSDNPVPWIVRLKALRPHEYIEKNVTVSMSMTAEVPGVDVVQVLQSMLGHLTEPTRQLLAQGAPAQLEEGPQG